MSRNDHHCPRYTDLIGSFKTSYHLEMILDRERTNTILKALHRMIEPDMVVCELGCGTGIFTLHAAERAQKVYAVEVDSALAKIAARNIAGSSFADRIQLIEADAHNVTLPEKVDLILCEMMSIWAVEEPQVTVFNSTIEKNLKPNGTFLPQRITNLATLGAFDFGSEGVEIRTPMPLFTGVKRPAIFTETRVAKQLDFSATLSRDLSCQLEFKALAAGVINCVQLTSIVQFEPNSVFSGSDSLMPPTVVPLAHELPVEVGDQVRLRGTVKARSALGDSTFEVELVSS